MHQLGGNNARFIQGPGGQLVLKFSFSVNPQILVEMWAPSRHFYRAHSPARLFLSENLPYTPG